jgi:hypothetical protein
VRQRADIQQEKRRKQTTKTQAIVRVKHVVNLKPGRKDSSAK